MSKNLKALITDLGENPDLLRRYQENPEDIASHYGYSSRREAREQYSQFQEDKQQLNALIV